VKLTMVAVELRKADQWEKFFFLGGFDTMFIIVYRDTFALSVSELKCQFAQAFTKCRI
jgi:hypothetical protein